MMNELSKSINTQNYHHRKYLLNLLNDRCSAGQCVQYYNVIPTDYIGSLRKMGKAWSHNSPKVDIGRRDHRADPTILRYTGGRLLLLASVLHCMVSRSIHSRSCVVPVRFDDNSK